MPAPPQPSLTTARSLMADRHARETTDDLHCWWLPPEIFADIGIAAGAAGPASDVERVAARLASLLGGGGGGNGKVAARSTPQPPPAATAYQQREQVCGVGGMVLVPYGGGVAAAAPPWPFLPNSPVQWQVPINHANAGAAAGPSPLMHLPSPPPPNWPGSVTGTGTGVFLPRTEAYRSKPPAPVKSPAKAAYARAERYRLLNELRRREAAPPPQQHAAAAGAVQHLQQDNAAAAAYGSPELRLPKEWVY